MPANAPPLRTVQISTSVPAVYVPSSPTGFADVSLESVTYGRDPAAILVIQADGYPFSGDVEIRDDQGELLGRAPLLVYTRTRVRVPLVRPPSRNIAVHFVSFMSGPEPVPVILAANPQRKGL